jgi:hypothetical protein
MITNPTVRSARAEKSGRRTRIIAGALTLAAMLLPVAASGMDSTSRLDVDRAGNMLRLPPVPYLDSMRWMNWKPGAPAFKVDTLLLPDRDQSGLLRVPSGNDRNFEKMS